MLAGIVHVYMAQLTNQIAATYWVGGQVVDCPVRRDSQTDYCTHSHHGFYGNRQIMLYIVICTNTQEKPSAVFWLNSFKG